MSKPLVGLAFGDLERNEDALAYLEGVLEGLQAGGQQLPVFVPEVGGGEGGGKREGGGGEGGERRGCEWPRWPR